MERDRKTVGKVFLHVCKHLESRGLQGVVANKELINQKLSHMGIILIDWHRTLSKHFSWEK